MIALHYRRRQSAVVHIGRTPLGGANPVRIQSMADVSTLDTEAALQQSLRLITAGAEYIRFTAQGTREAQHLGLIRQKLHALGYDTPLIADIHFNHKAAEVAAANVEKVRINPGNYADGLPQIRERLVPLLRICRAQGTALRIGVNHGSLSDRILNLYGDTPEGMVASCMEYLRICRDESFDEVVISMKASNTSVMVQSVRLLVRTMDAEGMFYPLHLGVTEAGDGEDGRIKSAVGIGALLADGIGDTLRVSLSEPPEAEIPVARKLVDYFRERANGQPLAVPDSFPLGSPEGLRRATSRPVGKTGGANPTAVVSDRSRHGDLSVDPANCPDYIYIGARHPDTLPGTKSSIPLLVDVDYWDNAPDTFPYFSSATVERIPSCYAAQKWVELASDDLNDRRIELLRHDPAVVLVFNSRHPNPVGEARAFIHRLNVAGWRDVPVVLRRHYRETDRETFQLKAAADFGSLLLDGIGNGVFPDSAPIDPRLADSDMFGLLQAARVRISKTEYISCPGCGRTLYNLQSTLARVKAATAHLKGLKIGIMGCIVNGPGEMADADYGYVGAGKGRISLYKGRECVLKNIPEAEAVEQLLRLIQTDL